MEITEYSSLCIRSHEPKMELKEIIVKIKEAINSGKFSRISFDFFP
jgi:hypothetical protein